MPIMDRVTLPKIIHKVELEDEPVIVRRGSVPIGQTLPAWEQIPLDAKFPMIPAPKGSVVLATTELCKPKHCATREHDFDLTDPNAFVMSNDYSALHDPHLKAHFGSLYMRRHLIQNGFITPEGQVVCSLQEFNEYRRYLRKLCLLELAREKRQREKGLDEKASDERSEEKERLAIVDLRARIREQEETQRLKFVERQEAAKRRMEKRQAELEEKQIERETKRRENDGRRRQIISEIQESERTRNANRLQKWEQEDKKRQERIEKLRKKQTKSYHKKLLNKWNERRRFQMKRLAREADRREEIEQEKQNRIELRKNKMQQQWKRQEDSLNQIRCESAMKREASAKRYEKRMATLTAINTLSDTARHGKRHSPYRSLWVLERVLRRFLSPDNKADLTPQEKLHQDEIWTLVNGIIDNAVEVLRTEGAEREQQVLREGAQAVVQWTIDKLIQENTADVLEILDEDSADGRGDGLQEGGEGSLSYSQTELQDSEETDRHVTLHEDISSEDFLDVTSPSALDGIDEPSSIMTGTSESFDGIIQSVPNFTSANKNKLELTGKSLTILRHSFMRLDQDLPEDLTTETSQVILNLNTLLEDIANDRCSRHELEQIVEFAAGRRESNTDNIVDIILDDVLRDIMEGRVSHQSLTRLVEALVSHQEETPTYDYTDPFAMLLNRIVEKFANLKIEQCEIQCLIRSLTRLFRTKSLHINSQLLQEPILRLIEGRPSPSENIELCKALVGRVLKDLVCRITIGEKSDEQILSSILNHSLSILGDQMCTNAKNKYDLLGINVVAETIVDQAMVSLVKRCMTESLSEREQSEDSGVSLLVHSVVTESLILVNPITEDLLVERNIPPNSRFILSNIFRYLSEIPDDLSTDERQVLAFSKHVVVEMLQHFAKIISNSNFSSTLTCISSEEYLWAKNVVKDVFHELARQIPSHMVVEEPIGGESLMEEIISEMDEFSVHAKPTSGTQYFLPHEISEISVHISEDTLSQLVSLFPNPETKKSKKIGGLVSEVLQSFGKPGENLYLKSTASTTERIANEALRQLQKLPTVNNSNDHNNTTFSDESKVISNTLKDVLKILSGMPNTSNDKDMKNVAGNIIKESLTYVIQNITETHESCQRYECTDQDIVEMECIRQLLEIMLHSVRVVKDNIDLESSYAASHLVKQTLQHLSELMVRSLKDTPISNDKALASTIYRLSFVLSEGSMQIGDKQSLSIKSEMCNLTDALTDKLNQIPDKPTLFQALGALEQLLDSIFSKLATQEENNTDTLMLAGRLTSDIVHKLRDAVPIDETTDEKTQLKTEQLDELCKSWANDSRFIASVNFRGCSIIAGDIVKELLGEFTGFCRFKNESNATTKITQYYVVMYAIANLLSKLRFTATCYMTAETHCTDINIIEHLSSYLSNNMLEEDDIICVAQDIMSCFVLANLPQLNTEFIEKLENFIQTIIETIVKESSDFKIEDLFDNESQESSSEIVSETQGVIADILTAAKTGTLDTSVIARVCGMILQFNSKFLSGKDELIDLVETLTENLKGNRMGTDEIKYLIAGVLRAATSNDKCPVEMPLLLVMETVHNYEELKQLSKALEEDSLPCYVIISVGHALSTIIENDDDFLPDQHDFENEYSNKFVAHYKAVLGKLIGLILDTSTGFQTAHKISSVILACPGNFLNIGVVRDPQAWKEISILIIKLIDSVCTSFKSEICKLTRFAPFQTVCKISVKPDETYGHPGRLGLLEMHFPAIKDLVGLCLEALMLHGDFEPYKESTVISPISAVAQDIVDSVLEKQAPGTSQESLIDGKLDKGPDNNEKSKTLVQTKVLLLTLHKSFREIHQVLFHPSAYTRHKMGQSMRRALKDLIHEIDSGRFALTPDTDVSGALAKWWNEKKAFYHSTCNDLETRDALARLVSKIKEDSKIIGPPRKHEEHATVKITQERVKHYIERVNEEDPDAIQINNFESLCSVVANELVSTMLQVIDNEYFEDDEMSQTQEDNMISDFVDETLQVLKRESFTDFISEQVTTDLLEKVATGDSTESLTLARVTSFINPKMMDKPSSEHLEKSCSGVADIVDSILEGVKQDLENSDTVQEVVHNLMAEIQLDKASSEVASQMVNGLINILKDGSVKESSVEGNIGLDIDPSDLACRAVDSVIKALHLRDDDITGSGIQDRTENSESTLKLPTLQTTPSDIAGEIAEDVCTNLVKEIVSDTQVSLTSSAVSKIADLAVQSLTDTLKTCEPQELSKIESFLQKVDGGDSDLIEVISGKSEVISPSPSLTEPVVHMIMAALDKQQSETEMSPSNTSEIAEHVVSSIIKLMNRCVSPESCSNRPKSARVAVESLVGAMERDLLIAQRLQLSSHGSGVDSKGTESLIQQANTTILRVKEILLKIIQEVSSSRLSNEQIEDIASAAAGEMVKTFTFEPVLNASTSDSPSPVLTDAVKSLARNIEDGNYNDVSPGPSPTDDSKCTGQGENSNACIKPDINGHNRTVSNQNRATYKDSTANIISDALNNVLKGIKENTYSSLDLVAILENNEENERKCATNSGILRIISEEKVFKDDSMLAQRIARETLKLVIGKLKKGSMAAPDIDLLASAIKGNVNDDRKHDQKENVDKDFVLSKLENTLLSIDQKGLNENAGNILTKIILKSVVEAEEHEGINKSYKVTNFLSKILCHLLTSSECIEEDAVSDSVTERDSFAGIVVNAPDDPENVKVMPLQCGEELHVDPDVTAHALSAISIRGHSKLVNPHEPIARNSFRDLHHPDLVRTEVLSHDKPEVAEAKLEWVAQQNLNRVGTHENVELAAIAEKDPSTTCSSSSETSSIEDIDGKLQTIIQLTTQTDDERTPDALTTSQKLQTSANANSNTNSPKLLKPRAKHQTQIAYLGNLSSKSLRGVASNSPDVSKTKQKKESKLSKTITPTSKRLINTPPVHPMSPLKPVKSHSSERHLHKPVSSAARSLPKVKREQNTAKAHSFSKNEREKVLKKPSSKAESKDVIKDGPARVQSLCGSHSTMVTVRKLKPEQS